MGPPRLSGLKFTLVAGLALLTTDALFAQSAGQSDVDSLKTQMNQMQKQYEQRIEAMEAKMKALESNANSGSILNTRVLTDANGTEAPGKGPAPMLDESFLKSLTRNFTFNIYLRAGVGFNGSGGGQTFAFVVPDNYGGRFRLGNENDEYMELSFSQAHILGDSPDLMDISARITPNFGTNIVKNTSPISSSNPSTFVGMREAYVEAKNVIKSAPEITFWGGQRFYDRYNIDSNDYFWLDTSGFGIGVYNIHAGPGTIWLAWLGGVVDNLNLQGTPTAFNNQSHVGDLFKQTFDLRYKDIDIGFGKLSLVGLFNYMKGSSWQSTTQDGFGVNQTFINEVGDNWGAGGGAIWQYDFGNKSYLRVAGFYGYGATEFDNANESDPAFLTTNIQNANASAVSAKLRGFNPSGVTLHPGGLTVASVNPIRHSSEAEAIAEFIWNPTQCFSLGVWAVYNGSDRGFNQLGVQQNNINSTATTTKFISGYRNIVGVGIRPVVWLADNLAIQGSFGYNYVSNVRAYAGTPAFGQSGNFGVFTIAPTIKPKGGYFTRPEIRLFATCAVWSNSLKGTQGASGGGNNNTNFGVGQPPYNQNSTMGWVFGSQAEIWF